MVAADGEDPRFYSKKMVEKRKTKRYPCKLPFFELPASVAQMAEQLICNQWVGGSIPFAGSK